MPSTTGGTTHLFVTHLDEGWSVSSPQHPGFVGLYDNEAQFRRHYKQDLRWAGMKGRILGHRQIQGDSPDGREFLIRWAEQPGHDERLKLTNSLFATLAGTDFRSIDLDELQPDRTGVYQFVVCLADDTVGWLVEQLGPRDTLIASLSVADVMIAMTQISSEEHVGPEWKTLPDLGWDDGMTMGELMARRPTDRTVSLQV